MKEHFPGLVNMWNKLIKSPTAINPKIELTAVPFKDAYGDICWKVSGNYNGIAYSYTSYSKNEALGVIRRRIKTEIKADKILSTREKSTHLL